MRKTGLLFLFLLLGVAYTSSAQNASQGDFFAGKWEISIPGTPNGDVKLLTDLVRKDGMLTGELLNPSDPDNKRPITKVVENSNKLSIYFESQAGEMVLDLDKVDNDNLKGMVYSFEATAKRIK